MEIWTLKEEYRSETNRYNLFFHHFLHYMTAKIRNKKNKKKHKFLVCQNIIQNLEISG